MVAPVEVERAVRRWIRRRRGRRRRGRWCGRRPGGGAGRGWRTGGGAAPPVDEHPGLVAGNRLLVAIAAAPGPVNVKTVLLAIAGAARSAAESLPREFVVPVLTEVMDPLETLAAWDGMSTAEVRDHLAGTLNDAAVLVGDAMKRAVVAPAE